MRSIAVIALLGQVVLGQQFTNSSTSSTTSSTSTSRTSTTTTTLITTTDSTIIDETLTFPPDPPTTTDTTATSTTVSTTSTTSVSSSVSATSTVSPNPANVGGFSLLGCYGSPSSFPTFTLTLSAEAMTIDRCVAACPAGKRFAGLFGNDCFCGDFMDDVNEPLRPEAECNILCPGNPRQRCGGRNAGPILKAKRQIIPSDIRFTIYVRVGGVVSVSVSGTVTVTVTAPTTGGLVPTFSPVPNPCSNGKCFGVPCWGLDCYKKIVSFGDYCAYDYPCFGSDCKRRLVWEHGVWRPERCSGYDCGRKVKCISGKCSFVKKGSDWDKEKITCYGNVCKVDKCYGDECSKKYVCKDKSCVFESCPKDEANKKYECESDKCKVVKPCEDDCPVPALPTPPPGPPGATSAQPPAGPDATAAPTGGDDDDDDEPEATATAAPTGGDDDEDDEPEATATAAPTSGGDDDEDDEDDDANYEDAAPTGAQPTDGAGAGSGPDGPLPPAATTAGRPQPSVVVVAGSNKFVASFGALAFSVIAAAILL